MGIVAREQREKWVNIWRKMAENFEKYSMKVFNLHAYLSSMTSKKISMENYTKRPIIVKM